MLLGGPVAAWGSFLVFGLKNKHQLASVTVNFLLLCTGCHFTAVGVENWF